MSIVTTSRPATYAELAREVDRRGRVIEQLEASLTATETRLCALLGRKLGSVGLNVDSMLTELETVFVLTRRTEPKTWEVRGAHAGGKPGANWVAVTDSRANLVPPYRRRRISGDSRQ